MTPTKADMQRIGQWLVKLRRVTSGGSEDVSKEALADYCGWLASDFPVSVFTDASAKFVAEQGQYFPKFAILKAALTEWRDKNPEVPRIASPLSESVSRHISMLNDDEDWKREQLDLRLSFRRDWQDPHKVAANVANIQTLRSEALETSLGRLLGMAVKRHAPHNLGFVPPEWHPIEDRVK